MNAGLTFKGNLETKKVSGKPKTHRPLLMWRLKNSPKLWSMKAKTAMAHIMKIPTFYGELSVRHLRNDGDVVDYGVLSNRLVTDQFVNFMVAQLQAETTEWGDFKYHEAGTHTTEASTTQIKVITADGTSGATGTQTTAAANIYKSVGTIAYTTTKAITEHALMSSPTTGTCLDRHTFAAINVANGDSIEFTYQLTCTAGG
jgi:hypothetical protein